MLFVCHPKILHKHCLQFLLGVKMVPWGDKERALWYVMAFSGVSSFLCGPRAGNPQEKEERHMWKMKTHTTLSEISFS